MASNFVTPFLRSRSQRLRPSDPGRIGRDMGVTYPPSRGIHFGGPRRRGARSPVPLASQTGSAELYGQAPETMSADGPAFLKTAWPTVDWMQYVVAVADCTTMCLMPASYEAWRTADVAPA